MTTLGPAFVPVVPATPVPAVAPGGVVVTAVALVAAFVVSLRPSVGIRVARIGRVGGLGPLATLVVRAMLLVVAPALAPGLRGPARGHAVPSVLLSAAPLSVALLAPLPVRPVVRRAVPARVSAVSALVLGFDAGTPRRPGVVRTSTPVPVRVPAVGSAVTLLGPTTVSSVSAAVFLLMATATLLSTTVALVSTTVSLMPTVTLSMVASASVVAAVISSTATVALLVTTVAVTSLASAVALLVASRMLLVSSVTLLVTAHAAVVSILVLCAPLAIPVGGVAEVVGVALVGGVSVAVPVRLVVVPSSPALVAGPPFVVVQSSLVGLVASSVFSIRICHGSPPPRVADSAP